MNCSLMVAAREGRESVIKHLLAHADLDVNLVNNRGESALMLGARRGHEGVTKHLLAHGNIQVNLADDHGSTALHLAACNGHKTVVEHLLMADNIDVNAFDKNGDTALTTAAQRGHEVVVRMFLDILNVGTTIRTRFRSTTDGRGAMSAAQASGHNGIVEPLHESESQKGSVASHRGISPLSVPTVLQKMAPIPTLQNLILTLRKTWGREMIEGLTRSRKKAKSSTVFRAVYPAQVQRDWGSTRVPRDSGAMAGPPTVHVVCRSLGAWRIKLQGLPADPSIHHAASKNGAPGAQKRWKIAMEKESPACLVRTGDTQMYVYHFSKGQSHHTIELPSCVTPVRRLRANATLAKAGLKNNDHHHPLMLAYAVPRFHKDFLVNCQGKKSEKKKRW
ncbi:ankyrin repeat-containing domain protein [Coprinopsis sp. MPI-PUGE-AT-0042]|nr:ankyrin repeat-containing domain protein [Coprinopsis sp. MPI-PUGE-AT-0042]